MSTLLWFFISLLNSIGVESDLCEGRDGRALVVGARCKTSEPPAPEGPKYTFEEPLEISNGF